MQNTASVGEAGATSCTGSGWTALWVNPLRVGQGCTSAASFLAGEVPQVAASLPAGGCTARLVACVSSSQHAALSLTKAAMCRAQSDWLWQAGLHLRD